MATRNILHISKLQEFEDFLETKGYMIVATSNLAPVTYADIIAMKLIGATQRAVLFA